MKSLKCRLGFHKFKYVDTDRRFLPKVLVLRGECVRPNCMETQNFFLFADSKKVVVENHGFDRAFGEVTAMPMEQEDLNLMEILWNEEVRKKEPK